jgi:putative hydrolase of the HAD superfamily
MTNWLLVDYGETISGPFATDAVTQLATLAGQDPHEFLQRYWLHRPGYDLGQPSQSYWSRVLRRDPTDIEPIIGELNRIDMAGWSHLNHDTLNVLRLHIEPTGARLALLSNAPEPLAATIDNTPWSREFTYRIYSCRIREVKPDPAAFTTALELLDAEPHRVLFIDDRPDNTRAATLLGIRATTFTSANDLANELSTIRGETATHPTRHARVAERRYGTPPSGHDKHSATSWAQRSRSVLAEPRMAAELRRSRARCRGKTDNGCVPARDTSANRNQDTGDQAPPTDCRQAVSVARGGSPGNSTLLRAKRATSGRMRPLQKRVVRWSEAKVGVQPVRVSRMQQPTETRSWSRVDHFAHQRPTEPAAPVLWDDKHIREVGQRDTVGHRTRESDLFT